MKPEEIRAIRKKLNLTQEQFGGYIGITRRYVIQLEKGEKVPKKTITVLLECLKKQLKKRG